LTASSAGNKFAKLPKGSHSNTGETPAEASESRAKWEEVGEASESRAKWENLDDFLHRVAVEDMFCYMQRRLEDSKLRRATHYVVPGSRSDEVENAEAAFNASFPDPEGFKWSNHDVPQGKPTTVECGLYLKLPTGTRIQGMFKNCADAVVNVSSPQGSTVAWAELMSSENSNVLLVEAAETPESLWPKLWQLQQAIQFGPAEFRTNTLAAVVCLGTDKLTFEALSDEIRKAMLASPEGVKALCSVPVFAVWAPHRNVLADLKESREK
jgi:hypothetical protein